VKVQAKGMSLRTWPVTASAAPHTGCQATRSGSKACACSSVRLDTLECPPASTSVPWNFRTPATRLEVTGMLREVTLLVTMAR